MFITRSAHQDGPESSKQRRPKGEFRIKRIVQNQPGPGQPERNRAIRADPRHAGQALFRQRREFRHEARRVAVIAGQGIRVRRGQHPTRRRAAPFPPAAMNRPDRAASRLIAETAEPSPRGLSMDRSSCHHAGSSFLQLPTSRPLTASDNCSRIRTTLVGGSAPAGRVHGIVGQRRRPRRPAPLGSMRGLTPPGASKGGGRRPAVRSGKRGTGFRARHFIRIRRKRSRRRVIHARITTHEYDVTPADRDLRAHVQPVPRPERFTLDRVHALLSYS